MSLKFKFSVSSKDIKKTRKSNKKYIPKDIIKIKGNIIATNHLGDTYVAFKTDEGNKVLIGDDFFTANNTKTFFAVDFSNNKLEYIKYINERKVFNKSTKCFRCKFGDEVLGYIKDDVFCGLKRLTND